MNLGFENEQKEYKKSTGELKEGMISLCSMLNKNGYAELYFGVKNNGDVIGQQIGDSSLRDISQAISVAIKPQVIPTIQAECIDNNNIIKVVVSGKEKPYSAYGKYYIRSADEDKELSPTQLKSLMTESYSDNIVEIIAPQQNLQFSQLLSLYTSNGLTLNPETFKSNLNLLTSNQKLNYMAYLLSDNNDISIKVVTFKGKNKNEIIKRNEYGFKCLLIAMNQVLDYVEAINDTNIVVISHQREEQQKFNFSCFREAWINACVHNRWSKQTPPAVYIFDDRIEIISTGGLCYDFTTEEFYKGVSNPVNASLQKIFGQLGFVEQTGHDVPLIVDVYGKNSFDIMENFINVTIPFNEIIKSDNFDNLSKKEKKLIEILIINPSATVAELTKTLGLGKSTINERITTLKKKGIIERVGSNKSGYWKILKNK